MRNEEKLRTKLNIALKQIEMLEKMNKQIFEDNHKSKNYAARRRKCLFKTIKLWMRLGINNVNCIWNISLCLICL